MSIVVSIAGSPYIILTPIQTPSPPHPIARRQTIIRFCRHRKIDEFKIGGFIVMSATFLPDTTRQRYISQTPCRLLQPLRVSFSRNIRTTVYSTGEETPGTYACPAKHVNSAKLIRNKPTDRLRRRVAGARGWNRLRQVKN